MDVHVQSYHVTGMKLANPFLLKVRQIGNAMCIAHIKNGSYQHAVDVREKVAGRDASARMRRRAIYHVLDQAWRHVSLACNQANCQKLSNHRSTRARGSEESGPWGASSNRPTPASRRLPSRYPDLSHTSPSNYCNCYLFIFKFKL